MRIHLNSLRIPLALGIAVGLSSLGSAQSNLRPGTNVSLSNLGGIGSPTGSRTGAFPNGMQSWGVSTTSCNVGSVHVPWIADMNIDHPAIGMFMYRDHRGRCEHISLFTGV